MKKLRKPYSKYYTILPNGNAFGIEGILEEAGLTYIADVYSKPEYEDILSGEGIEYGILAEDLDGNQAVYYIYHDRICDIYDEIKGLGI